MTAQSSRAGSTSEPCPTCRSFMNHGGYCPDQWHRPVTAQPSPDLPDSLRRQSGNPSTRVITVGTAPVVPSGPAPGAPTPRPSEDPYQAAAEAWAAPFDSTPLQMGVTAGHAGLRAAVDRVAELTEQRYAAIVTGWADRCETAWQERDQARAQLAQMTAGRATWKAKALEMERARDLAEVDLATLAAIRAHYGTGPETGPSATHSPEQATVEGYDPDGPQDGSGGAA